MKKNEYINEYCTGCGLCHSIKGIPLVRDDRGFPNVKLTEKEDVEFFQRVCPVFYYSGDKKHDVWGIIEKALIGYSANCEVRHKAASGGALTELCSYLLESREVDGIIHTTVHPEDPTQTVSCISTSAEELFARCGSRYSISVPLDDLLKMVEYGKKYAFIGKPCDVMALRRYMEMDVELSSQIVYLLSFFCAGEPSVNAQNELLQQMGCTLDECESLTYRGNGWPGFTTVVKKNGKVVKMEYKEAWGKYLGRDIRNICRFCMDGTGDAADIVCADFWHLDKMGNPDFSEHEGRNIIITRNGKGQKLLDKAVRARRLIVEMDFTDKMEEAFYKYQPAQYKRKGTMKSVVYAMKLCGHPAPNYSKSYLNAYAVHMDKKIKVRYFAGIVKRVLMGKI